MANNVEEQGKESITLARTYETKPEFPVGGPSATIYFHGLLCLCFDGHTGCEVGVNTQTPSHRLRFEVWKKGSPCAQIPASLPMGFELPAGHHKMNISVNNPVEAVDGVYVYAPASESSAGDGAYKADRGRYSYVKYCVDLEGPDFHDKKLIKKPEALWPRFYINNGLFYTHQVTKSRCGLDRGGVLRELAPGNLGLSLAADIFLGSGGSIDFVIDDEKESLLTLRIASGEKYEIAITNSCASETECGHPAASLVSTVPNDFYLYYKALDVADEEQFDLVNIANSGDRSRIQLGACISSATPVSDPAPCMSTGYGKSTHLT